MKLIKAQNTNSRTIYGKGVQYDINGQVILDTSNVMMIPKGTTEQRPDLPENGHFRYNEDSNTFEVYSDGWNILRYVGPSTVGIVRQTFGNDISESTLFGPLNNEDPLFPIPESAQSILVFVENVYQIPDVNYTLRQVNSEDLIPLELTEIGWYLEFTEIVPLAKPVTVIHNIDK